MLFLAAVAVFGLSLGGFLGALGAFVIFASTMGVCIFLLSFLGATAGQGLGLGPARALRLWGERVQPVAAAIVILVGLGLSYDGATHYFDTLLLGGH